MTQFPTSGIFRLVPSNVALIEDQISRGFGVEDISVNWGVPLHFVRSEVHLMRLDGRLAQIFPGDS